jgi:hypothetical protein
VAPSLKISNETDPDVYNVRLLVSPGIHPGTLWTRGIND